MSRALPKAAPAIPKLMCASHEQGESLGNRPQTKPQPRDLLTSSTSILVVSATCGDHCTQHGDRDTSMRPLERQAPCSDLPGASGAASDRAVVRRRSQKQPGRTCHPQDPHCQGHATGANDTTKNTAMGTKDTAKDTATSTAASEPHSLHSRCLRFLPVF